MRLLGSSAYLLKRPGKGGEHYGVGLRELISTRFGAAGPAVVHVMPNRVIVSRWDQSPRGPVDAAAPVRRLDAQMRATYDLFSSNCEHFALQAVFGVRASRQVNAVIVGLAFIGLLLLARSEA